MARRHASTGASPSRSSAIRLPAREARLRVGGQVAKPPTAIGRARLVGSAREVRRVGEGLEEFAVGDYGRNQSRDGLGVGSPRER